MSLKTFPYSFVISTERIDHSAENQSTHCWTANLKITETPTLIFTDDPEEEHQWRPQICWIVTDSHVEEPIWTDNWPCAHCKYNNLSKNISCSECGRPRHSNEGLYCICGDDTCADHNVSANAPCACCFAPALNPNAERQYPLRPYSYRPLDLLNLPWRFHLKPLNRFWMRFWFCDATYCASQINAARAVSCCACGTPWGRFEPGDWYHDVGRASDATVNIPTTRWRDYEILGTEDCFWSPHDHEGSSRHDSESSSRRERHLPPAMEIETHDGDESPSMDVTHDENDRPSPDPYGDAPMDLETDDEEI